MHAATVMDWRIQLLQKISHIRIGGACQYQSGNFSDVFAYFRVRRDAGPVHRHSDKHPFYVRFSRGQGPSVSSPCLPEVFQFFDRRRQGAKAPLAASLLLHHRRIKKNAVVPQLSRRRAGNQLIVFSYFSACRPRGACQRARTRGRGHPGHTRAVTLPFTTFAPCLLQRGPGPESRQLRLGMNPRWIRESVSC